LLFGREHVDRHVATEGEEGFVWRDGSPILILTTSGRRTGEPRRNALIFERHGEDLLVVASPEREIPVVVLTRS
jgi:hypothetical protein